MPTLAILSPSSVPFTIGGAEKFWWGLHKALSEHSGAFIELLKIPCREQSFWDIIDSYRLFSEMDLSHFDMVITSKYPAWMVEHPNHVVYMQHTLRGLYDTYHFTGLPETVQSVPESLQKLMGFVRKSEPTRADLRSVFDMLDSLRQRNAIPGSFTAFPGPLIRELVHFFDRVALHPSQVTAYAAISDTVKRRAGYFPAGANIKVLHHPSDITKFSEREGQYIFTASRLMGMKRLDIIVEGMRYVTENIPLRIAGTGPELDRLKSLAAGDSRIEFLGHVPDSALPELYAGALFVPFVPYDEDYGLITIEAMRSGKAVVTVNDAGGVCEFVRNGETGFCVAPTPEAVGGAMQKLAADPTLACALGQNAKKRVESITWENTVHALLKHAEKQFSHRQSQGRSKILVVNIFSAANPISGGERRVYNLCLELARTCYVELLCLSDSDTSSVTVKKIAPFLTEIAVRKSDSLSCKIQDMCAHTGVSVIDIACMLHCGEESLLLDALRSHGSDAKLVVATHPYLYPAIKKALPDIPMCYDAHNVETDMKAAILDGYPDCDTLVEHVRAVEKDCCVHAKRIFTCSNQDATRFKELYGVSDAQLVRVPNGFNSNGQAFVADSDSASLRARLVGENMPLAFFMGSWHRPNVEAAVHICTLAGTMPEVEFLIMGNVCGAPEVRDAAPQNVHLLGILPEKEKMVLLRSANVALNPIVSGAGTNLKIIEYVAAGIPTLTTPFGLRGLDDIPAVCSAVHVADLPDFAQAFREVLQQPAPEVVRKVAAQYVRERFAWRAVMAHASSAVTEILGHSGGASACR